MKTAEILSHIQGNGGFDNFRKWNVKEIATWVRNYYNCSSYVAKKVAYSLKGINLHWVFPSEKSVVDYMRNQNIKKIRLYLTFYVNDSGQSTIGYSKDNVNADYHLRQKSISRKTKTFILE